MSDKKILLESSVAVYSHKCIKYYIVEKDLLFTKRIPQLPKQVVKSFGFLLSGHDFRSYFESKFIHLLFPNGNSDSMMHFIKFSQVTLPT